MSGGGVEYFYKLRHFMTGKVLCLDQSSLKKGSYVACVDEGEDLVNSKWS